jgi:hypothetical protein
VVRQLFVCCRAQRAALQPHVAEGGHAADTAALTLACLNTLVAVTGRHFVQRLPGED